MMLWYRVLVFLVICAGSARCYLRQNNVCQTLRDYKTMFHNKNCSYNPDVGSTASLIAKRYGYLLEKHAVTTEDGYILKLHRISGPSTSNMTLGVKEKQPIIIFHGLGGSSEFWMLQGKRSLAFYLADNGFDVWLGNLRGNRHSNKHINPKIKKRDYWNFGIHEMAIYDLPACIDFIANRTGKKGNLIYVGHSMGTTISYIYSLLKREHAEDNLKAIISLAPVAYMRNARGLFRLLAPYTPFLGNIFRSKGIYAIGQNEDFQRALRVTCGTYPLIIPCNLMLVFAAGRAIEEFQPELLPVLFSFYPSAISLKTFDHFAQIILSNGRFQMFDYGPKKNVELYNSTLPPEYDTSQISVPIHLFVGKQDILADAEDVNILERRLYSTKRGIKSRIYTFPYAHNDFFMGRHLDAFYKELTEIARL